MKHLTRLLLLFVLLLPSCMQNDGYIGTLFGAWAVDEVTVDGRKVDDYPYGRVFWRFQSDLVFVTLQGDHQVDNTGWLGMWHRDGGKLSLDFTGKIGDDRPAGDFPPFMLLPAHRLTEMTIDTAMARRLQLSYVDDAGQRVCFTLRKII